MKHPLYVGYFEPNGRPGKLQVSRPLDLGTLYPLLSETCDQQEGSPLLSANPISTGDSGSQWVGRIGGEDLYLKNGYLICPWLGAGFNQKSLSLVSRLFSEMGCTIYDPGDGVFYTPEELRLIEKEYYCV
jgi:hypothetical protein